MFIKGYVTGPDAVIATREEIKRMERVVKQCVKETGDGVRKIFEQQTRQNFPYGGKAFARSWRNRTYPTGQDSLNAASTIWSTEGMIAAVFDTGTIVRARGKKFLAIPLGFNLPGGRKRSARSRGNPDIYAQVKVRPKEMGRLTREGLAYYIKADRPGDLLWMMKIGEAQSKGRRKSRVFGPNRPKGLLQGMDEKSMGKFGQLEFGGMRAQRVKKILKAGAVPMYYLTNSTKLPKLLDFDSAANMGALTLAGLLTARLNDG
jgi:hypothetical protein